MSKQNGKSGKSAVRHGHAGDLTEKAVALALSQARASKTHGERNTALIKVSLGLGLRANEIAQMRWEFVLDESGQVGDVLKLPNSVAKWGSGAEMTLSGSVREALEALRRFTADSVGIEPGQSVFLSQKGRRQGLSRQAVVDMFRRIWSNAGVDASSHSGRRYFITKAARSVSSVGGSMQDVRALARHKNLATTQRYIAINTKAQSELVNIIGKGLK